ncbi:hypothetical protein GCM10010833_21020 [Blastomonas aquatica]|uniref:Phosphate starvation-inducible protein PsiF n=2 Tax=Blastomonas aquatica TaxID=1510276 RepID=A0ABQ1JG89_9SPHN|nr:hypothetical protein GCM10010833_21020 [Blastomonas aquatica]
MTGAQNSAGSKASRSIRLLVSGAVLAVALSGPAYAAADPGKQACAREARTLCPAEMKAMSRKRVEACMIAKVEQTSPSCKAAMYKIKAQREESGKR